MSSSLHCLFSILSRSLVSSCTPGGEITTNAPGNVERGTNAAKLPDDETTPHRHTQSTDRQTQKEEREESARPSVYPPVQLKRARASERASELDARAACQRRLASECEWAAPAHMRRSTSELRRRRGKKRPLRPSFRPSPSPRRERRSQRSLHSPHTTRRPTHSLSGSGPAAAQPGCASPRPSSRPLLSSPSIVGSYALPQRAARVRRHRRAAVHAVHLGRRDRLALALCFRMAVSVLAEVRFSRLASRLIQQSLFMTLCPYRPDLAKLRPV